MTYDELWHSLRVNYDADEARAVARWLLEVCFGMTLTDIVSGGVERLQGEQLAHLKALQQRLIEGEPVQYVAGLADFGPRQFQVGPGVLIPRPETFELCQWVTEDMRNDKREKPMPESVAMPQILDIGTGSGCIACTLAAELPQAAVTAWDISPVALDIARKNAAALGVSVHFEERDMLAVKYNSDNGLWDVIVSNPPYICDSEADDMASWVLDYEPEIALFVPDDLPMQFFLPISNYAQSALREGGRLYFEINPLYEEHIEDILLGLGFDDIIVKNDQFGKMRFMRATWH